MNTHPVNFAILQMLFTIPVLFLGRRFFIGGFSSLFRGNPNMDSLVAISASVSFIYSVVMALLISDYPHFVHSLYFESAAVVVALVSVGKYLEAASKQKTKSAITKLMSLTPDTAIIVDENGQWEVPTEKIKVGDNLLIKAGAKVPLDGIVTEGTGSINESMLTGESVPVEKTVGNEVIGGSISVNGVLYVKVTRIGADTTLSKIIKFVEEAQGKKVPIAKMADKVAGIFVPVVICIALLASAIWLITGAELSFVLKVFTSVLVIACPCAMGLATPMSIIVGTGLGASKGILIRSGEALEITHKITVAVFDKTGTITEGKPIVTDIIAKDMDENTLLSLAAAAEKLSDHPLAKAICDEYKNRDLNLDTAVKDFENFSGLGIKAVLSDNSTLTIGNLRFIKTNKIDISSYKDNINLFSSQGKTMVFISIDNKIKGLIAISDTIKPDAKKTIEELKKMGIKTVLLTGDNLASASHIGELIGIDEVIADVLPTNKAEKIKELQDKGETVMMVGDGINDAPALTQADIGCAIGNGSDIAIDSAQIVLMRNELLDVCRAIRLSRLTIRNIKQNLFWAFCYNTLGIPVAAGVLYPVYGLLLSPMIGGFAMSLSSLFVVTNALRLRSKKI